MRCAQHRGAQSPEGRNILPPAGFTLLETVIAIGMSAFALVALYTASAQALRIVRAGKEIVNASAMLQQRIESLRTASKQSWEAIRTPSGTLSVSSLLASASSAGAPASAAGSNFTAATETYTIAAYPAGSPSFTVTVANGEASVPANTQPLPAAIKCVKLTGQASWRGAGGVNRTRTLSTILTKGGL